MLLLFGGDRSYLQVPKGEDSIYGFAGVLEPIFVRFHCPVGKQGKDVGYEELDEQACSFHNQNQSSVGYLLDKRGFFYLQLLLGLSFIVLLDTTQLPVVFLEIVYEKIGDQDYTKDDEHIDVSIVGNIT